MCVFTRQERECSFWKATADTGRTAFGMNQEPEKPAARLNARLGGIEMGDGDFGGCAWLYGNLML